MNQNKKWILVFFNKLAIFKMNLFKIISLCSVNPQRVLIFVLIPTKMVTTVSDHHSEYKMLKAKTLKIGENFISTNRIIRNSLAVL